MSVTWQFHHDAEAAFNRIRFDQGVKDYEDWDMVRALIDATRPDKPVLRRVVPIASLAPDTLKGKLHR